MIEVYQVQFNYFVINNLYPPSLSLSLLPVLKASVSIAYPDKGHNVATIKISSNTDGDMSYRYLHFNSTNPTLQYSKFTRDKQVYYDIVLITVWTSSLELLVNVQTQGLYD